MSGSDRPRVFRDALVGADGTQAVRQWYPVTPVYTDGTEAWAGVPPRRVARAVSTAGSPMLSAAPAPAAAPTSSVPRAVVPVRAQQVSGQPQRGRVAGPSALVSSRPQLGAVMIGAPLAVGPRHQVTSGQPPNSVPAAPYVLPAAPTRQAAAKVTHFQGPVPVAFAPAAPTAMNPTSSTGAYLPAPPASGQSNGPVPKQKPLRAAIPPALKRKSGGGVLRALFFLIILFLVGSGFGAKILDAVRQLLDR